MNTFPKIATQLRLWRTRPDKRLTQEEVARRSGLTAAHYCKLENGKYEPSDDTLQSISAIYGISAKDLVSENPSAA